MQQERMKNQSKKIFSRSINSLTDEKELSLKGKKDQLPAFFLHSLKESHFFMALNK